jgi:hypothetical protein
MAESRGGGVDGRIHGAERTTSTVLFAPFREPSFAGGGVIRLHRGDKDGVVGADDDPRHLLTVCLQCLDAIYSG